MSSTFFGLTIGASGLNAFQASINTTANNISNVQTDGYSKQVTNLEASSSLRVFQRYGTTGTGVTAKSVTQLRDQYYDEKYWNNQSKYGEFDKKVYYMTQIENYFTDSSTVEGFSTIYAKLFNALDSLSDNAGDSSVRNEFISDAKELMTYFNTMANQLQELQSTINDEIKTTVDNVNSIAEKIAQLNKQINVIEMEGGHANELRDERALLVDELSEIIPVQVNEEKVTNSNYPDMDTGATLYTVKFNGRLLVDTYNYNTLTTTTRSEHDNQSDIDGLYDVAWSDSGATLNINGKNMTGALRALFQIRDGNNGENLTGKVSGATTTSITVANPSITSISSMNMAKQGVLTVGNTEYAYDGFSAVTDADGNIESYTFLLKEAITDTAANRLSGGNAYVGENVSYKGIPYYQNQLNTFLRSLAKKFNDTEECGYDQTGKKMGAFFVADDKVNGGEFDFSDEFHELAYDSTNKKFVSTTGNDSGDTDDDPTTEKKSMTFYSDAETAEKAGSTTSTGKYDTYYLLTALNCDVAQATQENPQIMSTQTSDPNHPTGVDTFDIVDQLLELKSDTIIHRGYGGDKFLQCIYSDITVDGQECSVFLENYTNIRKSIDDQRTSISGVDEDEEAINLVKFQNAYNLSSKCISVLAEMYDRLITQTGV